MPITNAATATLIITPHVGMLKLRPSMASRIMPVEVGHMQKVVDGQPVPGLPVARRLVDRKPTDPDAPFLDEDDGAMLNVHLYVRQVLLASIHRSRTVYRG